MMRPHGFIKRTCQYCAMEAKLAEALKIIRAAAIAREEEE
jgi:hypothetical protein